MNNKKPPTFIEASVGILQTLSMVKVVEVEKYNDKLRK